MSANTVRKYVCELEEHQLISTESTIVTTKDGLKRNSNLLYTICPILKRLVEDFLILFHPEKWKQIDWASMLAGMESCGNQTSSGTDFKGKTCIRYSNDVAYDFCRALEQQIGIQIFLPS